MGHIDKAELGKILVDPAANYKHPGDVLDDERLSRQEKIAVLKQWEADAIELEVADQENMTGGPSAHLHQVLVALEKLQK